MKKIHHKGGQAVLGGQRVQSPSLERFLSWLSKPVPSTKALKSQQRSNSPFPLWSLTNPMYPRPGAFFRLLSVDIFTFLIFLLNFLKTYVKVLSVFLYYFPLLWNAVDKQSNENCE